MRSNYIKNFFKRGGGYVFISTALVKFSTAILSFIVVHLMSKEEYGLLTYALSFYSVGIVFAGMGGNLSLLRFGSISLPIVSRNNYYDYTIKYGTYVTLVVSAIIMLSSLLPINYDGTNLLIILVGVSMVPYFLLETLRSYFRILGLNKAYSFLNISNSIVQLLLVVILVLLFRAYGYVFALLLAPLVSFYIYSRKTSRIRNNESLAISHKEYWVYGVNSSLGAVANQLVFSIAPFLLGICGAPEVDVANFKVATIIPFNLLTLPGILMITDFNYLSQNYRSKEKLQQYYKDYMKTILPISAIAFLLIIVFSTPIIKLCFGIEYVSISPMHQVLLFATFITYLFRNPLGNLLMAVGKANWNAYNSYFFCAFYIISSLLSYKYIGTMGVVVSLSLTFILSGFVSYALYKIYLNKYTL